MKQLTEIEAAWLAGFLDADGCLHIAKRKVGKTTKYIAKISAVGVNPEMIYRCHNFAGGGHVRVRERRKENYKDVYIWEAGPKTIRELLPQILPFLCKREQARNLIRCMEIVKHRGRVFGGGYGCKPMNKEEHNETNELFIKTKELHL